MLGASITHAQEARAIPSLVRLDVTRDDIIALEKVFRDQVAVENEQNGRDEYLNGLIKKPWGQEYRAFVDDYLDVWHLQINPGESTSVHAHPRKITYLLCLAGTGVSVSLRGSTPIRPGSVLRIARGAFHSTKCDNGVDPLMLIEVETPRNKFDLVRIDDKYDRARKQYEPHGSPLIAGRRRHAHFPNATYCPISPCGAFVFSIRTGMDVFYRGISSQSFLIKLGLDILIFEDVSILSGKTFAKNEIDTAAHYLCVDLA